jgi:hypothetical protein
MRLFPPEEDGVSRPAILLERNSLARRLRMGDAALDPAVAEKRAGYLVGQLPELREKARTLELTKEIARLGGYERLLRGLSAL